MCCISCLPSTPLPPRHFLAALLTWVLTLVLWRVLFSSVWSSLEQGRWTMHSVEPAGGVSKADKVSKQNRPTQINFIKRVIQMVVANISLKLLWVSKLTLLSLIPWGDFASAPSSGALSSRIAGLVLRNAKKCLHKVAVLFIWLLGLLENSEKHILSKQIYCQ